MFITVFLIAIYIQPTAPNSSFTITNNKEKQQILTFKKLERRGHFQGWQMEPTQKCQNLQFFQLPLNNNSQKEISTDPRIKTTNFTAEINIYYSNLVLASICNLPVHDIWVFINSLI